MYCGGASVNMSGGGVIDAGWKTWDNELNTTRGGVDCILMQYTGLKDKNGKEIYEGDILRYDDVAVDGDPFHEFYEVRFGIYDNNEEYEENTSGYGWWLYNYKFTRDSGEVNFRKTIYDYRPLYGDIKDTEVIGNIWENPELLKE
jgi:uncharacterized phage protein (TIGR01671 family)